MIGYSLTQNPWRAQSLPSPLLTRILEVARRLFLERGFKATTAEVAREAGVAEGSLFKRWKTKQELFLSAMSAGDEDPIWVQTLINNAGKGDLVEPLTLAAVGLQASRLLPPEFDAAS